MYALGKGQPSANKLLVKTRRGISQKFESLDSQQQHGSSSHHHNGMAGNGRSKQNESGTVGNGQRPTEISSSSPKPVFSHNGRNGRVQQQKSRDNEQLTPQHVAMINYIGSAWTQIQKKAMATGSACETAANVSHVQQSAHYYSPQTAAAANGSSSQSSAPSQSCLDKFEPFDLEQYWGRLTLQRLLDTQ